MEKKTLEGNPEHIERSILRPFLEDLCDAYVQKQNFIEYTIKYLEYIGDDLGECILIFKPLKGDSEKVTISLKLIYIVKDGIRVPHVEHFVKKKEKYKTPSNTYDLRNKRLD